MTEITVHEREDGQIVGFQAQNHSGFESKGNDIVCAGISTVFEVAGAGIDDLSTEAHDIERSDDVTFWRVQVHSDQLSENRHNEVQRLFSACRDTLENIAEHYPDHCSFRIKTAKKTT